MHITRTALTAGTAVALAAVALVACSDSRTPASPVDPSPVQERAVSTPATSAAVRANRAPGAFRRIPESYRWVGEEHNRLLDIALNQLASARTHDRAEYERMKKDCGWAFASVRDNLDEAARRGGFASRRNEAVRSGREGVARMPRCSAMASSMALFAPAAVVASAPVARQDGGDMQEETLAALSSMVTEVAAANSPADIDAAIARASATASRLPAGQSDVLFAAASLTAGSAAYWETVGDGTHSMSLFAAQDDSWSGFKSVVTADAAGCASFLATVGRLPLPWQVKIAGCLITGAVSSVFAVF